MTIGPDLPIAAFSAPSTAAAGASIQVSDTVTNKSASAACASSRCSISRPLALAGADNSVVETNEDNNMAFRAFAVGGDLRVTTLTIPAMAGPGQAISVSDTTANQGSGAIGATTTITSACMDSARGTYQR